MFFSWAKLASITLALEEKGESHFILLRMFNSRNLLVANQIITSMGKIHIEEMEFFAFHGHYQEEQIVGNRFLVDLEMETDLSIPAESDRLEDAVNYQLAYKLISTEMKRTKSNLVENIGKRILDALSAEMNGIKKVTLKIRKMYPPVGGPVQSVGVTMSREIGEPG
jgi:dihydroneopterin aldolase